jgi:hypothetical protein
MAPKRTDPEEEHHHDDHRSRLRKYGDEYILTMSMCRERDANCTDGRGKPEARVAENFMHCSSPREARTIVRWLPCEQTNLSRLAQCGDAPCMPCGLTLQVRHHDVALYSSHKRLDGDDRGELDRTIDVGKHLGTALEILIPDG